MVIDRSEVKDILKKYEKKLTENVDLDDDFADKGFSRQYDIFRKEALETDVTVYEKSCKAAAKILRVRADEKHLQSLNENIDRAHLMITADEAASFGAVVAFSLILIGILIGAGTYVLGDVKLFIPIFLVLTGAVLMKPLSHLPIYFGNRFRLAASNQMVLCVLYVVMYMRHTSNLEHAIKFAAQHIGPPLSLDLKKIFWNIETEKFVSIKESLDDYLEGWKKTNIEFVESFHLIESSLYEPTEGRRIEILEKSLEVMLEGTYDRMLHYAHNLSGPITFLHMFGIVLPLLMLIILPLAGTVLSGLIRWHHLFVLYNVLLPVIVIYLGSSILQKRPTGYGESEYLKTHPEFKRYGMIKFFGKDVSPKFISILIGAIIVIAGFSPLIIRLMNPGFDTEFLGWKLLDFKRDGLGPFGIWSLIISLLIPIGLGFGIMFYYRAKTKKIMVLKRVTDDLEKEFAGALFQLGNRIGDGIPTEAAFAKVAESMHGTPTGDFFRAVDTNIRKLGYDVKRAIFDDERGAILGFPSPLIESSMKVLVQSSRKGPMIVSKTLITFSDYVNRIKKINERLRDLLAEVISSMQSQVSFLTPLIAAIVVSVSSMLTSIINSLSTQFSNLGAGSFGSDLGGVANVISILRIEDAIPGFYFQLVVGLYVVQITIILTYLSNGIERGVDKLQAQSSLSGNIIKGVGIYVIVTFIGVIIFNTLANAVNVVAAG